ncbi:MAG: hypothetical protein KY460_10460, partial [Actinobacteria bacterium]|nr:hypothetical protein [Actinomycetota bacterium]
KMRGFIGPYHPTVGSGLADHMPCAARSTTSNPMTTGGSQAELVCNGAREEVFQVLATFSRSTRTLASRDVARLG